MMVVCTLGLLAASAMAAETESYPKSEIFGGYQYSRLEGGFNTNGFDFGYTGNFNSSFGIAADFSAGFNTTAGVKTTNYTYTFGPQLSLRANKAYTPFVHALIGGDHASVSGAGVTGTGNGYAILAGGGVDFNFSSHMAFRGGADWLMLHSNGATSSKNMRMITGIVFRY